MQQIPSIQEDMELPLTKSTQRSLERLKKTVTPFLKHWSSWITSSACPLNQTEADIVLSYWCERSHHVYARKTNTDVKVVRSIFSRTVDKLNSQKTFFLYTRWVSDRELKASSTAFSEIECDYSDYITPYTNIIVDHSTVCAITEAVEHKDPTRITRDHLQGISLLGRTNYHTRHHMHKQHLFGKFFINYDGSLEGDINELNISYTEGK